MRKSRLKVNVWKITQQKRRSTIKKGATQTKSHHQLIWYEPSGKFKWLHTNSRTFFQPSNQSQLSGVQQKKSWQKSQAKERTATQAEIKIEKKLKCGKMFVRISSRKWPSSTNYYNTPLISSDCYLSQKKCRAHACVRLGGQQTNRTRWARICSWAQRNAAN